MSHKKEIAVVDQSILDQLAQSYPSEPGALRITLPRISMKGQDEVEETGKGKDKKIKVIVAAGTFFTEYQSDDVDENGKKIWAKSEIGDTFEGIIIFKRKQLSMYDEATKLYTSSPVYDNDDEVIPLFSNKKEIDRGTPGELKQKYLFTDARTKKVKSRLEDNRILYVLKDGEMYQMNIRGSSMWSYNDYAKRNVPSHVVTEFSSTAESNGGISWNKMSFTVVRKINAEEATDALERVTNIKNAIAVEKASYAAVKANDSLEVLAAEANAIAKDF